MEQSLSAFAEWFRQTWHIRKGDMRDYSPLTLAYIGDAVYELVVRSYVVGRGNAPVEKLHMKTSRMVRAQAQACLIEQLKPVLTEEELAVYRRGRNARSATKAKNATTGEYRRATGCEALIGYLFLTEEYERLVRLIHDGLKAMEMIEG